MLKNTESLRRIVEIINFLYRYLNQRLYFLSPTGINYSFTHTFYLPIKSVWIQRWFKLFFGLLTFDFPAILKLWRHVKSVKLLAVKEMEGRGACTGWERMEMNRFTTNQNFCAADTVERGRWRSTPEASRLSYNTNCISCHYRKKQKKKTTAEAREKKREILKYRIFAVKKLIDPFFLYVVSRKWSWSRRRWCSWRGEVCREEAKKEREQSSGCTWHAAC